MKMMVQMPVRMDEAPMRVTMVHADAGYKRSQIGYKRSMDLYCYLAHRKIVKSTHKCFVIENYLLFNGRICQWTLVPVKLYGRGFSRKIWGR